MNPRVTDVDYKNPYRLILSFENKEIREFDLSPYLNYPVFKPLTDESLCSKPQVFNGTVKWNDVIDFDPDTLFIESIPFSLGH
jgi:hypothetical protein